VGLLLINAATVILMFFLANRLFGPLAGLAAGSSYALLSTSESVLGFAGHATHFVVLAALGGILVLLEAIERQRKVLYLASGLLLGVSFVCKQPGIFFVLFGDSSWLGVNGAASKTGWPLRDELQFLAPAQPSHLR
jgi:asparagine N-glycosylation enzyme membrane subunit Stt3